MGTDSDRQSELFNIEIRHNHAARAGDDYTANRAQLDYDSAVARHRKEDEWRAAPKSSPTDDANFGYAIGCLFVVFAIGAFVSWVGSLFAEGGPLAGITHWWRGSIRLAGAMSSAFTGADPASAWHALVEAILSVQITFAAVVLVAGTVVGRFVWAIGEPVCDIVGGMIESRRRARMPVANISREKPVRTAKTPEPPATKTLQE